MAAGEMGIKSSLLDSRLTAAVIRRRDRAEIIVVFFLPTYD